MNGWENDHLNCMVNISHSASTQSVCVKSEGRDAILVAYLQAFLISRLGSVSLS